MGLHTSYPDIAERFGIRFSSLNRQIWLFQLFLYIMKSFCLKFFQPVVSKIYSRSSLSSYFEYILPTSKQRIKNHDLPSNMDMDLSSQKHQNMTSEPIVKEKIHGHMLSASDPDNPQNWPIHRKVYASMVSTVFAFAVSVTPFSWFSLLQTHF
jgi:hypothetical protein